MKQVSREWRPQTWYWSSRTDERNLVTRKVNHHQGQRKKKSIIQNFSSREGLELAWNNSWVKRDSWQYQLYNALQQQKEGRNDAEDRWKTEIERQGHWGNPRCQRKTRLRSDECKQRSLRNDVEHKYANNTRRSKERRKTVKEMMRAGRDQSTDIRLSGTKRLETDEKPSGRWRWQRHEKSDRPEARQQNLWHLCPFYLAGRYETLKSL